MQKRTKVVSSSGCSSVPRRAGARVQIEQNKSPARNHAAGLDSYGQAPNVSAMPGEVRNVATAEADFGQILVGQHLIGRQTILVGPIGLVTGTLSGNKARKNHDLSLKSVVCCSAI